jgi:hypothetical protein
MNYYDPSLKRQRKFVMLLVVRRLEQTTIQKMEDASMSKRRVVSFVTAALLSISFRVTSLRAADADGVMMQDGKMMMMREGKPAGPMDHEMTMSNGTKVEFDGAIKMKDGTVTEMKDGQMMMMDGHIMEGGRSRMMSDGSAGGENH